MGWENEAQREEATCLTFHSELVVKLAIKYGAPNSWRSQYGLGLCRGEGRKEGMRRACQLPPHSFTNSGLGRPSPLSDKAMFSSPAFPLSGEGLGSESGISHPHTTLEQSSHTLPPTPHHALLRCS